MRYAIGDIHGCIKTLKKLIDFILANDKHPEFYSVGDLIDRGPDSKAVLNFFMGLKDQYPVQIVRGNHEEMMLNNLFKDSENWFYNGAESTLKNFRKSSGINTYEPQKIIPKKYIDFIASFHYYIELDDFFIVHAGFNFSTDNPLNDTEAMVWTRIEENDFRYTKGKKIIHGHTPIPFPQIKMNIQNSVNTVYNIDSGCVYIQFDDLGSLTALNMDTLELINIKNVDL